MPRWTEEQVVNEVTQGVERCGVAAVLKQGEVIIWEVLQQPVPGSATYTARYRSLTGSGLDAQGGVVDWSEVRGRDLPHLAGQSGRRAFLGVSAMGAGPILISRSKYLPDGARQLLIEDRSSYPLQPEGLFLPSGDPTSLRAKLADINPNVGGTEDVVFAARSADGRLTYRFGWQLYRGGFYDWTTEQAMPGTVTQDGFDVAVVVDGARRHLLFYTVAPTQGGYVGRYRFGHELDTRGNVGNWGDWQDVPGIIQGPVRGVAIAVADAVAPDKRPDLLVVTQTETQLRYRIGFNILDLLSSTTAAATPAGSIAGRQLPRRR